MGYLQLLTCTMKTTVFKTYGTEIDKWLMEKKNFRHRIINTHTHIEVRFQINGENLVHLLENGKKN